MPIAFAELIANVSVIVTAMRTPAMNKHSEQFIIALVRRIVEIRVFDEWRDVQLQAELKRRIHFHAIKLLHIELESIQAHRQNIRELPNLLPLQRVALFPTNLAEQLIVSIHQFRRNKRHQTLLDTSHAIHLQNQVEEVLLPFTRHLALSARYVIHHRASTLPRQTNNQTKAKAKASRHTDISYA